MPIEIRELVVRARIDPGAERSAQGSGRGGAERNGRAPEPELVRACVQEALRAVADRRER